MPSVSATHFLYSIMRPPFAELGTSSRMEAPLYQPQYLLASIRGFPGKHGKPPSAAAVADRPIPAYVAACLKFGRREADEGVKHIRRPVNVDKSCVHRTTRS